ncbi:ECF transporter S component [Wohlfahrtiimonas larvae]|uniref:ECF transporter S component n=1 Tax=Wohlfahrtiimonas larvae TaxID=1157986 RepID=A0ABP9MTV6_9GAMM|nr:ECF transporter S component [Wohlfahrtiimonas larvae]
MAVDRKFLTTHMLVLISTCIAINMVLGQVASIIKLPIFLDSIGTFIAALLGGPWIAALTGLLTNLIWGLISSPVAAAFAPVAIVIGLSAGFLARTGMFNTWYKVVISGVIITICLTLVATPIRTYLFAGVTGSGADFIVAYIHATGEKLWQSVASTIILANLADKIITGLIAWQLVKHLPKRTKQQFPQHIQ